MESPWFDNVAGTRFDRCRWVPEIGSTNTELLAAARRGEAEGAVLIADLQTAGRGRRGRTWTAPPGTSLMISVLLRPAPDALTPSQASLVTSAFAAAAVEAVAQLTGAEIGIKWPNDLVVDSPTGAGYRKLAGILTESVVADGAVEALVVGMGMNTGWPEVPAELSDVATSLNLLVGAEIDRPRLARTLLSGFDVRYRRLVGPGGVEATLAEARAGSATLGRQVRVELNDDSALVGIAWDLDADGRLVVRDDEGRDHAVSVGDVVHLRPNAT